MQPRILITGASGYIGSRMYQSLKQAGYDVTGIYHKQKLTDTLVRCDITDTKFVNKTFGTIKPDIILHFASVSRSTDAADNPQKTESLNVQGTHNIVSWAKKNNANVIYISTFACYKPESVLGKSKFQAEKIIQTLLNWVIIRPSYVIGVSPNTTSNSPFNEYLQKFLRHESIVADTSWTFEATYIGHLYLIIDAIVKNSKISNVIIPVVADGVVNQYTIVKDLFEPLGAKVVEVDKKRFFPLPTLDRTMYRRFNLPKITYIDTIQRIQEEIKVLMEQTSGKK